MRKLIGLFLSLLLMISMSVSVMAADNINGDDPIQVNNVYVSSSDLDDIQLQSANGDIEIVPYWTSITTITNNINMSGGTSNILVNVKATSGMTSIKIVSTIQKSSLLFFWNDVVTFTKDVSGNSGTLSTSYYTGSGTFRLKTTVTVYQNGIQKESTTVYNEG